MSTPLYACSHTVPVQEKKPWAKITTRFLEYLRMQMKISSRKVQGDSIAVTASQVLF